MEAQAAFKGSKVPLPPTVINDTACRPGYNFVYFIFDIAQNFMSALFKKQ